MNMRRLAVATVLVATAAAAQQPFQLDPNFHFAVQSIGVGDVLERPDGKIIVSGNMLYPDALSNRSGLLLEPSGVIIPGPTGPDQWYWGMGGKMIPWGTNKFYAGGIYGEVKRFWLDGSVDLFFHTTNPFFGGGQGGDFHVFPDGRVLITGSYELMDTARGFVGQGYGLVWLTSDGSLDTTRIHRYIGWGGMIKRIRELSDGRFICGGRVLQYEGEQVPSLVYRVEADGAMDTTFHGPLTTYGYVDYFLEQPDGKVLMTGTFCFEGSTDTLGLVRLLPNGQLDPTFNNTHQFRATYHLNEILGTRQVRAIGEDLLAVTGDFDRIDGEVHGGIAMLDNAGNVLPGYFEGSGCGAYQYGDSTIWQYPQKFIVGITPAQDGGYFIYGAYHGYDDGTGTNGGNQRLISKLYGLNVGITENAAGPVQTLQIAPNPSSGATVFSVASRASSTSAPEATAPVNAMLTIHDGSGRVVWQTAWPAGAERYTLPAGALAPGAYVVRVASRASATARASATGSGHQGPGAETLMELYTGRLVVMP